MRSHVQIKRMFELPTGKSPRLNLTLDALHMQSAKFWDKNIPAMVDAYFRDLERVLKQCQRLLKPSGMVMMVVGDSRYANVCIEVAEILAELARNVGFCPVVPQEVHRMSSCAHQLG